MGTELTVAVFGNELEFQRPRGPRPTKGDFQGMYCACVDQEGHGSQEPEGGQDLGQGRSQEHAVGVWYLPNSKPQPTQMCVFTLKTDEESSLPCQGRTKSGYCRVPANERYPGALSVQKPRTPADIKSTWEITISYFSSRLGDFHEMGPL